MKRTIIAVIPAYDFNGTPSVREPNIDMILELCKAKKAAIALNSSIPDLIQFESDLEGLDEKKRNEVHQMIENVQYYIQTVANYWDNLFNSRPTWMFVDYKENLLESTRTQISALKESSFEKRNYLFEKSYYDQTIGRAEYFAEAIEDQNIEVLITDFVPGYFLSKLLKDEEVEIHYDVPGVFDLGITCDQFDSIMDEYLLFSKWDQKYSPDVSGTWDVHKQEFGEFKLYYCSKDEKTGKVEGVISDTFGWAVFKGELNGQDLTFEKKYLYSAIERNSSFISTRPIFYKLDLKEKKGYYAGEKEAVFRNPCVVY